MSATSYTVPTNDPSRKPTTYHCLLGLLKDELEADQARLPAEFNRVPTKLLKFLVQEAGEDRNNQINYIEQITVELEQIGQADSPNKVLSSYEGIGHPEASKTQGMLPGAHKASPTEEWQDRTRREHNL
jgi:hypothetical protein